MTHVSLVPSDASAAAVVQKDGPVLSDITRFVFFIMRKKGEHDVCAGCGEAYKGAHACPDCGRRCHPFCGQAVSEGYGAPVRCPECSSKQKVEKPKKKTVQEQKSSTVLQAGTGTAVGQQNFIDILMKGQKPQRLVENAKPEPQARRCDPSSVAWEGEGKICSVCRDAEQCIEAFRSSLRPGDYTFIKGTCTKEPLRQAQWDHLDTKMHKRAEKALAVRKAQLRALVAAILSVLCVPPTSPAVGEPVTESAPQKQRVTRKKAPLRW